MKNINKTSRVAGFLHFLLIPSVRNSAVGKTVTKGQAESYIFMAPKKLISERSVWRIFLSKPAFCA